MKVQMTTNQKKHAGMALPVILMLLIVITMMGISTIKTGNFQAIMASNNRSVNIVDQAAETAIDTVIVGVMKDKGCFDMHKATHTAHVDEILQGENVNRTDAQKAANSVAMQKIENNQSALYDTKGPQYAANNGCIVDSYVELSKQKVEAASRSWYCDQEHDKGSEVGKFSNYEYKTLGSAKMAESNNKLQANNVQLWTHKGLSDTTPQPFDRGC